MKTSLKASLIALAIASIPLGSHAAGLGQINVFTGLGQPLRAEIQVNASPQELQSLTASIASPDAFRQARIPYTSSVAAMRLSVDTGAARPVIRLSSDRPINDPFVNLLVELNWGSGSITREYTFLLDPVDLAAPRPLAAAVDTPATVPARAPVPVRSPQALPATPESYTVRRGDTLHRIAASNAQPGVTLDQMLIALYRANRNAFDGDNINRLRAGEVLSVPSAEAARNIDPAEARREIRAHAADFEAYRRSLAGAVARRAPSPAPAVEQESGGQIVPRVEEAKPLAETGDQLKVSRSQPEAGSLEGDTNTRLQALEEELAAREKSLDENNARLTQIESSLREMQKLLELRSGSMAQLQQAVPPQSAPPPAATPKAAPPATPAAQPQPSLMDDLLGNPSVVAGGAGIAALLLGYLGIRLLRRRKAQPAAAPDELAPGEQGVFASTGGQSVDTGASSIMQTDFSQAGLSAIDADEGVDPVAEADVYMAYGRDAQAEEILLDALKADPARAAIYLKLLEIYAQRGDVRQFETVASELFARTNGKGPDWDKAAALGRKVDPGNPLYAQSGAGAGALAAPTEVPADAIKPAAAAAGATAVGAAVAGLQDWSLESEEAGAEEPAETEQPAALDSLDFSSNMQAEPTPSQMRDTWAMPGELDQFAEDKNAGALAEPSGLDQAPAELEAPEVAGSPQLDIGAIDFELDLGDEGAAPTQSAATQPEVSAAASAEAQPFDDAGLTFDLEIDEPQPADDALEFTPSYGLNDAPTLIDEDAAAAEYGAESATVIGSGADLAANLDFELPDLELQAPDDKAFDLNQTMLQPDALTTAERDEPATVESAASPNKAGAGQVEPETTGFDNSLLEFDFDLDTPSDSVAAPSLDLSSIDLELDGFDAAAPGAAKTAPEPALDALDALPPLAEPLLPDQPPAELDELEAVEPAFEFYNDDVGTKLELARAYDDMGDKEGALELLEEVLREGSDEQQAAAREMIARLS